MTTILAIGLLILAIGTSMLYMHGYQKLNNKIKEKQISQNQNTNNNDRVIKGTIPCPYHIILENTTDEPQKAKIFGFNSSYNEPNFGSDKGIEIMVSSTNITYAELLAESALQPFEINLIRLQTMNPEQFKEDISYTDKVANGQSVHMPMQVPRIDRETYNDRNQKGILEIETVVEISGSSFFELTLLPKQKLTMLFFKKSQASLSGFLRDIPIFRKLYANPQISGEPIKRRKIE